MKSETLVWVIGGVGYLETVVRRERRGTSHGVSIRVAKGLYYRPSTFRSRPIEWEETVHADTGLRELTTKHVYFAGSRKRFRVRYDRIVSFDPYDDGFGIMRDAQTAKPWVPLPERGSRGNQAYRAATHHGPEPQTHSQGPRPEHCRAKHAEFNRKY